MRARVLAPGLAVVGVLAASGCGSDATTTVTRSTDPSATTAVAPTTTSGPATTASREATATATTPRPAPPSRPVVRTTTTTATTTRTTERTVTVPATRSVPTTPMPAADPDPVGGTVPARGRVRGTNYSVVVPTGWNDAASRYEGDRTAFDLNLAKRPGPGLTSLIFTDSSRPVDPDARSIEQLADGLRQEIVARAPTAQVLRGPALQVDGEPAVSFRVRRVLAGVAFRQRQVLMLRDGLLVVARLTSRSTEFRADVPIFERFLDSWRWD